MPENDVRHDVRHDEEEQCKLPPGGSVRNAHKPAMQHLQPGNVLVEVTSQKLQLSSYVDFVQDDSAGAVATFSGVTRNTFEGKMVVTLEYEAYTDMAEKTLRVCARIADRCCSS